MTRTTDGSTVPTDMSRPDPAEALLLKRELAGLTALTVVRGIAIAILFVMTLAVGFSGSENEAPNVERNRMIPGISAGRPVSTGIGRQSLTVPEFEEVQTV